MQDPSIRSNIMPLSLLILLLTASTMVWVWPTPWRYDHVENTTARTNRFPGQVQTLTLKGWQTVSAPASESHRITREDLQHVELNTGKNGMLAWAYSLADDMGIRGSVYNSLPKPLIGEIYFHVVQKKGGQVIADRRLRCSINWPAQQVIPVNQDTGLMNYNDSTTEVTLESVP